MFGVKHCVIPLNDNKVKALTRKVWEMELLGMYRHCAARADKKVRDASRRKDSNSVPYFWTNTSAFTHSVFTLRMTYSFIFIHLLYREDLQLLIYHSRDLNYHILNLPKNFFQFQRRCLSEKPSARSLIYWFWKPFEARLVDIKEISALQ